MFWDKKENSKSLPDLPPLHHPTGLKGDFSHVESENQDFGHVEERHELPSFPDSMNEKGFSQSAIKGAVSESSGVDNAPAFPGGNKFGTMEMEEWEPGMPREEMHEPQQVSEPPRMHMEESRPIEESGRQIEEPRIPSIADREEKKLVDVSKDKNADVFVKLDKFYSARKTLMDVQQNLEDVDELLKKIRETKMREEQELIGWEKEMGAVKARLNEVTVNLFEKVN